MATLSDVRPVGLSVASSSRLLVVMVRDFQIIGAVPEPPEDKTPAPVQSDTVKLLERTLQPFQVKAWKLPKLLKVINVVQH